MLKGRFEVVKSEGVKIISGINKQDPELRQCPCKWREMPAYNIKEAEIE